MYRRNEKMNFQSKNRATLMVKSCLSLHPVKREVAGLDSDLGSVFSETGPNMRQGTDLPIQ